MSTEEQSPLTNNKNKVITTFDLGKRYKKLKNWQVIFAQSSNSEIPLKLISYKSLLDLFTASNSKKTVEENQISPHYQASLKELGSLERELQALVESRRLAKNEFGTRLATITSKRK